MKKTFLSLACIIVMILGLFLVSCQEKQTSTRESGGYGEEAPAAGGYGEEAPPAESGGYGE